MPLVLASCAAAAICEGGNTSVMTTSGLVWTAFWMSGTSLSGWPWASMMLMSQPFASATSCIATHCWVLFTLDCDQET